jgi:hypothetical protein
MHILKVDETIQMLASRVHVYLTGETASGDLVRTIIVDSTVTCRMKRSEGVKPTSARVT